MFDFVDCYLVQQFGKEQPQPYIMYIVCLKGKAKKVVLWNYKNYLVKKSTKEILTSMFLRQDFMSCIVRLINNCRRPLGSGTRCYYISHSVFFSKPQTTVVICTLNASMSKFINTIFFSQT